MRCPLNDIAELRPDSPAISDVKLTLSFSELDTLVHHTAIKLKDRGFQRHSHIAVLGPNSIEYCILILAALRIGAIICPLNNRWPKKAISKALSELDCYALVKQVGPADLAPNEIDTINMHELISPGNDQVKVFGHPTMDLEAPAVMIFTTGSTSQPKAALLSYGNLYFNALGANERIPFHHAHRWLLTLPLYHVGGLGILFRSIIGGGSIVIQGKSVSIADSINEKGVTHLSLVPTQLFRMLNDEKMASLTTSPVVLVGGAPVSESQIRKADKYNLQVYTTYGLTEMASQVTTGRCTNNTHAGKLLDQRELKIAEDGEILVKGKTLFLGYVENNEAVLHLDDDGWFHTGDIGNIDDNGNLHFLGRKDNLLISGGENIHPEEIEGCLLQIDRVERAMVVAIPNEEYGQRPVAFVDYKNGNKLSDSDIVKELSKSLPKYKIPDNYFPWPQGYNDTQLKPIRSEFAVLAEKLAASSMQQTPKVSS